MNTNNIRAEKCSGESRYGSYATALMHFNAFSFVSIRVPGYLTEFEHRFHGNAG